MNIIMAVNMGGDDFIAKPFDLSVLTAKVQAMLRRTYEFAGETNFLEHRGAMLDTGSGVLNYRGKRIELTKMSGAFCSPFSKIKEKPSAAIC